MSGAHTLGQMIRTSQSLEQLRSGDIIYNTTTPSMTGKRIYFVRIWTGEKNAWFPCDNAGNRIAIGEPYFDRMGFPSETVHLPAIIHRLHVGPYLSSVKEATDGTSDTSQVHPRPDTEDRRPS